MAHVTYVRPRTLVQFSHGSLIKFVYFHILSILSYLINFSLYDIYYEEIPKHNHGFRYLVNWLINGYYIISMGRVNFNLFGFRLQLPTLAGLIRSLLPSAL